MNPISQIIKELSAKLNKKYGKGFSSTNLWYDQALTRMGED